MPAQLPNIELISSMHNFPGPYTFKIIADAREDFLTDVLTLAMSAVNQDREHSHTTRSSSSGHHTAITLSIRVETAEEVHAIYEKLLTITGLRALF